MQIKFLSKLSQLLHPRNEQEKPQPSNTQDSAVNLLSSETGYSSIYTKGLVTHVEYSISKLILYLQVLIYTIIFFYIFLVLFNLFLDWRLNVQKNSLDTIASRVSELAADEKLLNSVSERIHLYKSVTGKQRSITTKTDLIFSSITTDIEITEIRVDVSRFYVKIRGGSPIVFARLINTYLSKGITSEISLKSANFDPITTQFIVELEGTFK